MGQYDVENYACPRCGSTDLVAVHEPFCSHGRVNCKDCGAKTMRWERLLTKEAGAKFRKQIEKQKLYNFNIMMEAKVRAMVIMTHKIHPDWTSGMVESFLKDAIEYAVKKELHSFKIKEKKEKE